MGQPTGSSTIRTETIEDLREFSRLHLEWNELLAESGANTLFMTWEWLYIWWLNLAEDRSLHIVTVRQDGRLIGIAPLTLRPWRWQRLQPFRVLEFLGAGNVGSDYLNFIVRQGCESLALPAILEKLQERKLMLQLSQVERLSPLLGDVVRQLDSQGWKKSLRPVDRCPYVDLSSHSHDSYFNSLKKSHRGNYRRNLKHLGNAYRMDFELAGDQARRGDFLESLIALHLDNWRRRGGSNALHTASLQRFHESFTRVAGDAGWLRLFALTVDGRIVGVIYCLFYNKKYYFYQSGYDADFRKYAIGHCLVGLAINKAIDEGAEEFDFLRGDETYKYLWANAERALVRLEAYPPHLRGRLSMKMMQARQGVKRRGWHRPPVPLRLPGG